MAMTDSNQNKTTMPASQETPPAPTGAGSPAGSPSTATPAAPNLEALKAEAAKASENWDRYLRAVAELENYKKRVARENQLIERNARERVVAALLPVLDNLERALDAAHQHDTKNEALLQGIDQVKAQFRRTLEEFGLEEVKAHAGHPFDPNIHEAVSQIESAEHPEGIILNQLQRGYRLADRLLRPARVVVSKGPAAANP